MLIAERNGDAKFLREGQCDRFPDHRVDFIVLARNFAMARWASFPLTEALGLAPPREEPGANSMRISSSVSFSSIPCFGRGEQFREFDQRGDALDALLPQEGSAFLFPQSAARLRSMRRMSARPHGRARSRRWRRRWACLPDCETGRDQPAGLAPERIAQAMSCRIRRQGCPGTPGLSATRRFRPQ
jgi:hypothetical protein